ncbi:MAG: hypothetical protein HGA90_07325, partial [Alphaproteobacteria bacterium]|nr:hypothetical protein [Alphaproteobacteria bacterium]
GFAAMMAAIVVGFWAPRPDILVSPDGQQVGWRRADAPELLVAVLDEKDKFAAKYWGNLVGVNEEGVRFVSMEQAGPVDCDEKRCLAQYPSGAVSFVRNAEGLRDSCAQGYAVIIYTDNATDCGETQSRLITRETLRARGAQALYVTPEGFEVRAARDGRALRPWSVGWRPSRQEEERVRSIPE